MSEIIKQLDSVLLNGTEKDKDNCIEIAIQYIESLTSQRDKLMKQNETYKKSHDILMALQECGVDNWEGYSEAMTLLNIEEDDE